MGDLSNAMQSLVDDIKSSTDNRRVNISEMRSETGNMIERFHLAHQDMAKELQEKFSSEKATRVEDVERLMNSVKSSMNDIRSELRNMTTMLEEKLSSEKNARLEAVQQLVNGIKTDIQNIRTALEEKFSSEHALRMEAQEQFVGNNRDFMKNIGADLQNMAEALREKLSSEEAVRMKDIRQFIDAIAADCRKAHELWMNISVDTVEEEAVSLPAAEEETVAEEKEIAEKEEESLLPPIAEAVEYSSEARVLEVITKHSEGIKLVDIGNELGVDWRGLIGAVKLLVDEDKAEKTDNLYYPKS